MQIKRYAGIDIGSNAARLIIKDLMPIENNKFSLKKRVYIRMPLRMGYDVFTTGSVKPEKINDFATAIDIFKSILKYNNVTNYRACATSALRNAENKNEVLEKIHSITGIDIDIIDGYEESKLLYLTNREQLKKDQFYISADLGGGSLQLALFKYQELIWGYAFKTGTLRFLTNTVPKYEVKALEKKVIELKKMYPEARFIGSGGNINKISKMIGKKNVAYSDMELLYKKLSKLSYDDRMKKYALREDRADVIMPAMEMYMKLMNLSQSERIFVPKTGLADGIICSLYLKDKDSKTDF